MELVTTLQRVMDVLKRFSAPAGVLGEQWLDDQDKKKLLYAAHATAWPVGPDIQRDVAGYVAMARRVIFTTAEADQRNI